METLKTTKKKVNGEKYFYICAHNLNSAKLGLYLGVNISPGVASLKAYKFDTIEYAEKIGNEYLNSNFTGLFAQKEFMKQFKN